MALSLIPATNCWTKVETRVADVLVTCQTLLDFLGVADAEAAKAGNMFYDSIGSQAEEATEEEWALLFPQVLIGTPGDEGSAFEVQETATQSTSANGIIEVSFASMIKVEDYESSWHKAWLDNIYEGNPFTNLNPPTESDYERSFKNAVGNIMEEAANKFNLSAQLYAVTNYGRIGPKRQGLGDLQIADVSITWGTDQGGES